MPRTPRNLIVLSDGTGNSASNPFKTNVWRLYQALNLRDGSQIAVFGDGVGNSSIKVLRVLGLALGIGVKRNVLNLYKFLCRNYWQEIDEEMRERGAEVLTDEKAAAEAAVREAAAAEAVDGAGAGAKTAATPEQTHDRIWMFGFSRGAFTIRVLAALIDSQGLVAFKSEAELERNALAAYRAYRAEQFPTIIPWVYFGRKIRDAVTRIGRKLTGKPQYAEIQARRASRARRHVRIHFIGVWDTVAAYGLPIDELTIAVDRFVWPMRFRETNLLLNVDNARQAMGLDDERRTFHPIPWSEKDEEELQKKRAAQIAAGEKPTVPADRLLQVWFPGMHADVGGGYPDDGLSLVPLCWMIEEARAKGLMFEDDIVRLYQAQASPTGRLYDSRAGSGALWRYQPRNVQFLMDKSRDNLPEEEMVTPLVHHCAMTRMRYGNDGYAPISLPLAFDVLLPNGESVPFKPKEVATALTAAQAKLTTAAPHDKPLLTQTEKVLADLLAVVNASSRPERASYHTLVLDTVWWRRVVYFATLILALAALAWPVVYQYLDLGDNIEKAKDLVGDYATSEVRKLQTMLNGTFTFAAGVAAGFLPGFAKPWIDAVTRDALAAVSVVLLFLGTLGLSKFLQGRIYDRSRAAWNVQQEIGGMQIERLRAGGQGFTLLGLVVLFVLAAGLLWMSKESRIVVLLLATIPAVAAVLGALLRLWAPANTPESEEPKPLLLFARFLRTNRRSLWAYRGMAQVVAPAVFLVVVAYVAIGAASLTIFNFGSTYGAFCKASASPQKGAQSKSKEEIARAAQEEDLARTPVIKLDEPCNATGLQLVAGRQYRVRLDVEQPWFDRSVPADVGGFPNDGWRHTLATPFKRWWLLNWFHPIARVGSVGNYEYPLNPAAPLTKTNFEPCKAEREKAAAEWEEKAPAKWEKELLACEAQKGIRRATVLISDITPDATGELFIYVNDAVLAVPGGSTLFYRNNSGTAKVSVTRVLAPEIVKPTAEMTQSR